MVLHPIRWFFTENHISLPYDENRRESLNRWRRRREDRSLAQLEIAGADGGQRSRWRSWDRRGEENTAEGLEAEQRDIGGDRVPMWFLGHENWG